MKNYEILLTKVDKLVKEGMGGLYDRVKILVQVYNDPEFKTDQTRGKKVLTEVLDKRLRDSPCNFSEMQRLIVLYPRRTQWTMGDLSEMRLEMLKKNKEAKKENKSKTGITRNAVSVAQYRALEDENKALKSENNLLKQRIVDLEDRIRATDKTIELLKMKMTKHSA